MSDYTEKLAQVEKLNGKGSKRTLTATDNIENRRKRPCIYRRGRPSLFTQSSKKADYLRVLWSLLFETLDKLPYSSLVLSCGVFFYNIYS